MNTKTFFHSKTSDSAFKATILDSFSNSKFFAELKPQNKLIQSQTWADSHIDLIALDLKPAANIVTIAAGACHALAYLSAKPAAIHCVDENSAQLALLEIKAKALIHLPDYDAVLKFLAQPHQRDNLKRYQRHLRANLSDQASHYWQKRTLLGRPRYYAFSENLQEHGYYNTSLRALRFILIQLGARFDKLHQAKDLAQQNLIFEQAILPALQNKYFQFLMQRRYVLNRLGFNQNQITRLKNGNQDELSHILIQRLRRLLCDFSITENHFAQQVIGQTYQIQQQQSLPLYLQKEVFPQLRQYAHRVHPHQHRLINFLQQQSDLSIDAFVLQDHLDYLHPDEIKGLWQEINRCAAPGAKVLIRSLGTQLPLPQIVFQSDDIIWQTDATRNQELQNKDRCALYGSLFVFEKIIKN
jgi:S-adenosylmethionine-diacylglycerol 3-amino-3-carboxypropyl transferase